VSGATSSTPLRTGFDKLIGVNLKGPHFLTQLAARWMLEQGSGRIVFITSISSYAASVNRAEYCVSKAALTKKGRRPRERPKQSGQQVAETPGRGLVCSRIVLQHLVLTAAVDH
jgi:NAD(P)-dependent dehydrogenase (short-subunit alcohol dehydrogenase family)